MNLPYFGLSCRWCYSKDTALFHGSHISVRCLISCELNWLHNYQQRYNCLTSSKTIIALSIIVLASIMLAVF